MSLQKLLVLAAASLSVNAFAQEPLWWDLPVDDPIRFNSLRFDLGTDLDPETQRMAFELQIGYFNEASSSWHSKTIHSEFGRQGLPIAAWELELLELRHPDDEKHRLDFEGWTATAQLTVAIGQNLDLTVLLPWLEIGAPQWDSIPIEFHNLFSLPQGPHEDVSSAQSLVWVSRRTISVQVREELDGSGIGDLMVMLGGRAGRFLKADHRWYAAVEAPTGTEGTIRGSGGWDLGLRWSATWQPGRSTIRAGAGFTHLDPNGSWLGLERNNLWHLAVAAEVPIGTTFAAVASTRYERSPIADQIGGELGDPGLLITIGATVGFGSRLRCALLIDEGVPPIGVVPDIGLRFVLSATIPKRKN